MSDRAYSRLLSRLSRQEAALLSEAADRIHASRGLRLLVWRFVESCGMAQSPFSPDPLTMARNCGKLEAAHELIQILNDTDPSLFPALQKEMTDYDRQRTADLHDRHDDDTAD